MGKRKFTKQNEINNLVGNDVVKISEGVSNCLFFEVGNHLTTDICEAVAIMMRNKIDDKNFWNKKINDEIDLDAIEIRHCLYWLSGGDDEWKKREFYKRPWNECDLLFQEEFGITVQVIVKKAKTISDIRSGFMKFLNLTTFYEFALSKNLI